MKSGIYMIKCKETQKVYIGRSVNMKSRYQTHLSDMKNGRHGNPYLLNCFKKHGKEAFEFSILETCEPINLLEREYFWINFYDSTNSKKGFNIIFDSNREKSQNEKCNTNEYRKKQSEISKKRWQDPEYAKKNLDAIRKGHEERKQKGEILSILTPESRKKSYDSCHTPEFLKGLSDRSKKQMQKPEQIAIATKNLIEGKKSPKLLENRRKTQQSQEFREKMSIISKAAWIKRKQSTNLVDNNGF